MFHKEVLRTHCLMTGKSVVSS